MTDIEMVLAEVVKFCGVAPNDPELLRFRQRLDRRWKQAERRKKAKKAKKGKKTNGT